MNCHARAGIKTFGWVVVLFAVITIGCVNPVALLFIWVALVFAVVFGDVYQGYLEKDDGEKR